MTKWLEKIISFFNRDNIKKAKKLPTKLLGYMIESQIHAQDNSIEKVDEVIVSREITGFFVKATISRKNNIENVLNDTADKMNIESSSAEFSKKVEDAIEKNPIFFSRFSTQQRTYPTKLCVNVGRMF